MSYNPTSRQKIKEIKHAGFLRGEVGGSQCESCGKNCGRGWWQKVSFEHNEWSCSCRDCAYAYIHQWDDFDFDEFMRIHSKKEGSS